MTRVDALLVLGLPGDTFTPEDLKEAYRRMAKSSHPDMAGGSAEEFARVHDAYKTLSITTGLYVGTTPWESIAESLQVYLREAQRDRAARGPRYEKAALETKFKAQVVDALESRGAWTLKIHGHDMQKTGVPDLYVAHPRWTGWLELKSGSARLELLQGIRLRDLVARGVPAFVLRIDKKLVEVRAEYDDSLILHDLWSMPLESWESARGSRERGNLLMNLLQAATKEQNLVVGRTQVGKVGS